MKFEGTTLAEALAEEVAGAQALAAVWAQKPEMVIPGAPTVRDIVLRYKAAPDGFKGLAPSTQAQWTRWLDRIVDEFGDLTARALGAKGVRRAIIDWRDRWASTPRTADYGIQVLKRVLAFGVDVELCEVNPAEGIKALYNVSRADVVVDEAELNAVMAKASPAAATAFRIAAGTGLRRGDLVRVMLSDVSDFSIELATQKGMRKATRVIVPLLQDVRQAIAEIRAARSKDEQPSLYLLTTETGRRWTEHWLSQSWLQAAREAGVDKHLHDLRGTAATRFILGGLSDEQTGEILGWEPGRVTRIRRRYVDRERIARGVIAQLERSHG